MHASKNQSQSIPEITIEKDTQAHRWMIVVGSHRYATPFLDTTTPNRVINTLKHQAKGKINVVLNV